MGPLDKYILPDDSLSVTSTGFQLRFYSNWYRSLPISALGMLNLNFNGQPIDAEYCKIEYDGKTHTMADLPSQFNTWWFVLDPAILHVNNNTLHLTKGQYYDIELELGLLIPYVLTGKEEKPLFATARVRKNLLCA
jgi:hypothetical protein